MSSPPSTAALLLENAQQGSMSSLGRLMSLYSTYLKFVVSAQLDERLRPRVSPSDVVQETFFEAHRDFGSFRGDAPEQFLAWMRRILVNNLLRAVEQHVQTAKRDVRREVSLCRMRDDVERSALRFASLAAADTTTPSVVLQRRELVAELAAALQELPEDYREVIHLRHIEGLKFVDVAQRMERSTGSVRMLWLRAIKRLRETMDSLGGGAP